MPSLFHERLLQFFQNDLHNKRRDEGWDERIDPELRSFCDELSRALRQTIPISLEKLVEQRQRLLTSRPIDPELHLLRIFPDLRILRGLPRLYRKDNPSQSKIHPGYTNLIHLKKIIALEALCKLYEQMPLPKDVRISVAGDPYLCEILAEEICEAFPYLEAEVRKEETEKIILEIEGQEICLSGTGSGLKEHAMGLHFLERGVIISKHSDAHEGPFFADLRTENGVFVYFHALLKFLEDDQRDVEVFVPNFDACAAYFSHREKPFEKEFNLQSLTIEVNGCTATKGLASKGKKLRIFLTESGIAQCEEFFACGSESGLSRALSQNKIFFVDFPHSKRSLLKDLIALAANRLAQYPAFVELLRVYGRIFDRHDQDEWVDDLQWEEPIDLLQASEIIANAINNPEVKSGFQRLTQILKEEYSCNKFLVNLIQRTICHQRRPKLAWKEQEILSDFLNERVSFSKLIEEIKESTF